MPLTDEQRDELRRLLEREWSRLRRRLERRGEEVADSGTGRFSQHMAEQASVDTEREKQFLMASEEGQRLVEVDRARERLLRAPDRFGLCRTCGGGIGFERLEALPYTELCIECKRGEESGG